MKITILGCGPSGGVPMIGGAEEGGIWGACDPQDPRDSRTRSSIVIETDEGTRLLVDCGPDLRAQLLRNHIAHIDALIVTHEHADHIGGFDDIRGINRVIQRPLPLYASPDVLKSMQMRFPYAFKPWSGGEFFRPVPAPHPVSAPETMVIQGTDVTFFAQRHYKVATLGLRIGNFAYSTDVELLPDDAIEALRGVKTWVVGCLQREPHVAHACLDDVLRWRAEIKPSRVILTHMGPGLSYGPLAQELPPGMEPAYDSMTFDV